MIAIHFMPRNLYRIHHIISTMKLVNDTISVETLFLLYGVYLCFTVRKVPAHFNESKHITWAVYNAIILGTFMAFMS